MVTVKSADSVKSHPVPLRSRYPRPAGAVSRERTGAVAGAGTRQSGGVPRAGCRGRIDRWHACHPIRSLARTMIGPVVDGAGHPATSFKRTPFGRGPSPTGGRRNRPGRAFHATETAETAETGWTDGPRGHDPDRAGIDIGKDERQFATTPDRRHDPVRSFGGFTRDPAAMASWLSSRRVRKVATDRPRFTGSRSTRSRPAPAST